MKALTSFRYILIIIKTLNDHLKPVAEFPPVADVSKLQLLRIKNSQFKIIYLDSSTYDP